MWAWITASRTNKIVATIAASLLIAVLVSVVDGLSVRSRVKGYFDLAKGWADAYHRDIGETKKQADAKIKVLTLERDQARKKLEEARARMNGPWKKPAGTKEIEERFLKMGFRGVVR